METHSHKWAQGGETSDCFNLDWFSSVGGLEDKPQKAQNNTITHNKWIRCRLPFNFLGKYQQQPGQTDKDIHLH